ncbi:amidohydrolase family protein [Terriglobus albidus]|uniref:Amidohydrolase family protein n=1 Tax=Terriglobus albidus TaxID=1592106 RepID=A0A5B9EFP1_9BACT|nr:amidohydrolase family protein [Terriglobus albidus]QEE29935.1 amidohydrolase family protein [Terriglobus albidus]
MKTILATLLLSSSLLLAQQKQTVLHAARLYEAETGRILSPGEILVEGDHIVSSGSHVDHPAGAEVIDLGDRTLMPGLIDAHTHLFLHPGAEDAQTFEESVPQRTLLAAEAAKQDLLAGFTAERDMGTEGAGSADSAVRNAINSGLIPGPRMRVSGNAISITGGHEDAIHYNPELHVPSNATYADTADDLVRVIRQQLKEGADFIKIYATGSDRLRDGVFSSPYQYTEDQLKAAVDEARRQGATIGVHCSTDPAALFAVRAGVVSIDHADQLTPETMRLMREKQIYAVPTFAISEYFEQHAATPAAAASRHAGNQFHIAEFKKQMAAGVPFAVGSDVGPFPHGTQAREMVLMAEYGMKPADVLQADYVHGARLLGWEGRIGTLHLGAWADVIAVPGNPLDDISALTRVAFVMKNGQVYKR